MLWIRENINMLHFHTIHFFSFFLLKQKKKKKSSFCGYHLSSFHLFWDKFNQYILYHFVHLCACLNGEIITKNIHTHSKFSNWKEIISHKISPLFISKYFLFSMKRSIEEEKKTPAFNQIIFNLFVMCACECLCVHVCGQNTT